MAAANLAPSSGAREAMERLNAEAGKLHIWKSRPISTASPRSRAAPMFRRSNSQSASSFC